MQASRERLFTLINKQKINANLKNATIFNEIDAALGANAFTGNAGEVATLTEVAVLAV